MSKKAISLEELSTSLKEGLNRAATSPNILGYKPHEKQIQFHSSTSRGRIIIGGNRSGKTVGGLTEDVYWARGKHPFRRVPQAPTMGRIVTVSLIEGLHKIILPGLAKWIPPSDLINGSWEDSYIKSQRTLKLANKSEIEILTYEMDTEKFAGVPRDYIHFDEEPPKDIFTECKMRLVDIEGASWWITMTPVEGMTWVYDDIFLPGLKPGSGITVIIVDSAENPYISEVQLEEVLSGLDPKERQARKEGKFVQIGGLAYKYFSKEIHVIPPLDDQKLRQILPWTQYQSMDHGLNAPTCWLWHAVSPSNSIITFDEIYDNEKLIHEYASMIHARNNLPCRRAPDIYVGDPSIAQRNPQTGDSVQTAYVQHGIPIMLGNNDQKIGVEKANRYFKQGKWVITENCTNFINELSRQRWKIYESAKLRYNNPPREELDRKFSHAPDAGRYFITLMPDLYIKPEELDKTALTNRLVNEMLGPVTIPVGPTEGYEQYDMGLHSGYYNTSNTEWTIVDEHMGGIW